MKNKYEWDLEILLNKSTIEHLHNEWLNCQKQIINLYPSFIDSFVKFKNYLDLGDKYGILSNRLFNYVHNNLNEDIINPKWIAWSQKLSNEANELSTKLSDYEIRVIKNKKIIQKYLKDDSIKQYQRAFDLIFKTEPHNLSEKEEELLSKIDIYTDGFETIFNTLTDSEIKFEDAIDSKNKKVPLKTISDVTINIKSNKDRALRKSTWISFNKAYSKFENTLCQTLYHNYLMFNTHAKIHHFNDYIHSTTFADEINIDLITNLYSEVKKYKPLYIKYRDITNSLLKKQLHLNHLEPWDKTVDLIKQDVKYSIEESQQIVLDCFKLLGNDYVTILNKAFNENWISWLAKPNKQTGAYSISGTKGLSKYYISMNFDKTFDSLKTLVHELGHSLNSHYVNSKQDIYTSTPIFYAEVASITNELLLSYYLINKTDNIQFKIMLYEEMIGNFFNTTTRQIVFSNFEFIANQWVNDNQPFNKEIIKQTYKKLIEEYQGISKNELKKYDIEPYSYGLSTIFRIGHFYVGNFYVYKYAIGQIVATLIAKKIIDGDQEMIKNYFDFLSSGSSKSPLDTIKILGIDLNDKKIYHEVYLIVEKWIDEFKKISSCKQ